MKKKIIFQLLTKEILTVKEASNFNRGNLSLQFCQQTRRLIFSLLKFDASFTVSLSFVDKENRKINFVKWYHSLIAIYNTKYNKINFY